jgi:hypothetical protein
METVLIGTLGAELQVITLATALLRQKGVARVVAVHTDARFAPIVGALPALRSAFAEATDAPLLECVWWTWHSSCSVLGTTYGTCTLTRRCATLDVSGLRPATPCT